MSESLVTLASPRGTLVFKETAATSTDPDVSGNFNVFNKQAAVIYGIRVDASSNSGEDVYLCVFDAAANDGTSATVGTTDPDILVKCLAGKTIEMLIPQGVTFTNYVDIAVKQEAGTAGSTAPTGTVAVTLIGA